MRKALLLFVLLGVATFALAQKVVLTGKIVEQGSNEPLVGATAVLLNPKDSSQVSGAAAMNDGVFRIPAVKVGSYILRISYIGYKPHLRNIALTKSENLGSIALSEDSRLMKEALVVERLAQVEMKADTFVYNADAFRVPEGAVLEELVKKLPGVEVGDDGTIKVNGKSVKKILVDGKEFFDDDTQMSMKNIPTKMVKKIKAYDKKSDYSRVTGIDDGEEETVLDLSVKKGMKEGWIVNLDGGYGTKDRYTVKANVSRFLDHRQFSVIASVNNVNDQSMPGGGRMGGGGGSGIVTSQMGGANFAWENGKPDYSAGLLRMGGSAFFRRRASEDWSKTSSQTFLQDGSSTWANSISNGTTMSMNLRAHFRLEWMPDSMTNIIFRPNYTYSKGKSSREGESMTYDQDPYQYMTDPLTQTMAGEEMWDSERGKHTLADDAYEDFIVNHNLSESLSRSYSHNANASLQVNRRLFVPGRNVTFNLSGGYSTSGSNSWSINDVYYYKEANSRGTSPRVYTNRFNQSPSTSWNIQPRISYTEPLTRHMNLQLSYQFQYRYNNGERNVYSLDSLLYRWYGYDYIYSEADLANLRELYMGNVPGYEVLDMVKNWENSQYSVYNEYNHNAQALLRYTRKFENKQELRFNAGISFQPQRTDLDYKKNTVDTAIVRNVYNWAPRLNVRWKISQTSQLRANYRGSMQQPDMLNLIEVLDNTNLQNVSIGNSELESSWNNSFDLDYNDYLTPRQMGWAVNANFRQTQRGISTATIYDSSTGNRYTRPMNVNGNWSVGANLMFNTALDGKKHWSINVNTGIDHSNKVGYISNRIDVLDILGNAGSSTTSLNNITLDDMHILFDNALEQGLLATATTKTTTLRQYLRGNYRTDWGESGSLEAGLNAGFNYMHARNAVQSTGNMDTWNFNYGANFIINLPFGMSISTDIGPNYRRGYSDASMNTTEVIWNAQISQSFLKKRSLTITAQAFDLLQQRSNISRVISATMRSDTYTNAINSYFMFKVSYRLNLTGNKEARAGMGRPGEGPGGNRPGQGGGRGFGGGERMRPGY